MDIGTRCATVVAVIAFAAGLSGCILIRTTEHRINLQPDGSGEAVLRLIDIRTDELTDSLAERDFRILMSSFEQDEVEGFEEGRRKITSKRLFVRNDTLVAEIGYTFTGLEDIEGLHVTEDELYIVVNEAVKWCGPTAVWSRGETSQRIVWSHDARRLVFGYRKRSCRRPRHWHGCMKSNGSEKRTGGEHVQV
jgi:hypothetical protein